MPKPPTPRMNSTLGGEAASHSQEDDLRPTDIEDMSLSSSAKGSPVVVSFKRTVKLEGGVRMELRVSEPAPAK